MIDLPPKKKEKPIAAPATSSSFARHPGAVRNRNQVVLFEVFDSFFR
ncbi:MAG: hypothetical protein R2688_10140 [Fimbriimonadaceae bacterium]